MKMQNIFQNKALKKLVKSSGVVFLGSTSASALNMVSFAVLVNALGPELFGLIVLSQTYVLIINDIFNVQTWESLVKFSSKGADKSHVRSAVKTNILIDFFGAVVAFVVAFLMPTVVSQFFKWDAQIIVMLSLYSFTILFNLTTLTIGVPRIRDRFSDVAKIQVFAAVIKIILVYYGMQTQKSMIYYVYVFVLLDTLVNLLLITLSASVLKHWLGSSWWKAKTSIEGKQIQFIWWTNLRTIIRIPVRHFDVLLTSMLMSVEMVGIYKVYKEIAGILGRVGEPVNQVVFPEFSKLIGSQNIRESIQLTKQTIGLLFLVSAGMSIGLMLFGKVLLGAFFGMAFLPHINALYFLILIFGVSLVTVPINSLFLAAGFAKYGFYIVVFTNTVYLASAYFLGKVLGIYGIIAATGIQMVFNKGLKIFFLRKHQLGWNEVIR